MDIDVVVGKVVERLAAKAPILYRGKILAMREQILAEFKNTLQEEHLCLTRID